MIKKKAFDMEKHILLTRTLIFFCLVCFFLTTCQTKNNASKEDSSISSKLQLPDRPNILWLVTEDMGPYIPPFGDSTIQTPNLSRLADRRCKISEYVFSFWCLCSQAGQLFQLGCILLALVQIICVPGS